MQEIFAEVRKMQSRLSPADIPKMITNRRDWMYLEQLINLLLFNFPKLGEDKKNKQRATAFIKIAITQGVIEQNGYQYRIVEPAQEEASETQAA